MSDRKQGFDPLASLFEVPSLDRDPQVRPKPPGLESLTVGSIDERNEEEEATESMEEVLEPTEVDPVAIAKAVGRAAAQKAGVPVTIEQRRGGTSKEDRLMALAENAIEGSGSKERENGVAAFLNRVPKAKPEEPEAPRYGVKRSRAESIAARARPPIDALEAARIAEEREEKARKKKEIIDSRAREQQLVDRVQGMLSRVLPKSGAIYVANALQVEDRDVQRAIWRSHRARFLSDGALERAVGAAAVLHALEVVSTDALVAAYVVTDASDYLVWIDLDQDTVLAAFSDARSYFAAQG